MCKRTRIILDYVWCDSTGVSSKTMIIPATIANPKSWDIKNDVSWIPQWNVDIIHGVNKKLIPIYWCFDPFRKDICRSGDTVCIIVLCNTDERNIEYERIKATLKKEKNYDKLISIIQKYMITNKSRVPSHHISKIAEQHFWYCIDAGLSISEVNANRYPNQPEYKIGLCKGIDIANQVTISKYIMERLVGEKYNGYSIRWSSLDEYWGCHISYISNSSIVFKQVGIETIWQCEHNAIQKSIQQLTIPMLQTNYKSRFFNSPYKALDNLHDIEIIKTFTSSSNISR